MDFVNVNTWNESDFQKGSTVTLIFLKSVSSLTHIKDDHREQSVSSQVHQVFQQN